MAKEKTMSQKLRELADWLEQYEKWYKVWQDNQKEGDVSTDEGGSPTPPPPPPPHP